MKKKAIIGFVLVVWISLAMFGCFMEDGNLRWGQPAATQPAATQPAAPGGDTGKTDEVVGDGMMALGTLLGCPPLVFAGYMVGKLKVMRTLKRVVANVQEGRNAVKSADPSVLEVFDNAAREASNAQVDAVVKKIKKKMLIDPVTEE